MACLVFGGYSAGLLSHERGDPRGLIYSRSRSCTPILPYCYLNSKVLLCNIILKVVDVLFGVTAIIELKLCTGAAVAIREESHGICGVNHCKADPHIICGLHTAGEHSRVKHDITLFFCRKPRRLQTFLYNWDLRRFCRI